MRRKSIQLVGMALLATAMTLTSSPATAQPGPLSQEREWREVFSADGTITKMLLPKEVQLGVAAAVPLAQVITIQNTGPSSQRFDMVIIGDGYTATQMGTLRQHAEAKWNEIAATAPWSKYKAFVNVWLVNVISNQSGVDNDPTPGISRDTALDMYFWCGNIERLLCLNETKAQQYASQAPGVDAIVAVGNTTKYGGAGYPSLATVAGGNAQSGRIAIHELGHSVGGLADEYYTAGTTYRGSEPREPNVTTNSSGAKWASYLGQSTPDGGVIGAYRGGHQYEFGIYRPSQDSLMRSLAKPFNSVSLDVMDRAISAKIGTGTPACSGYQNTRSGSLSSGGYQYQPDGSYFYTASSGQHQACVSGSGVTLALDLLKWNGSAWQTVASGTTLTYNGTGGYYMYRVSSVSGSGTYTLGYNSP